MRVLVTGANGQVGTALLATASANRDIVPATRATLELADARQISTVIADARPDIVINTAAYTAVDRAESEEGIAHAVNAAAVGHIAAALSSTGGKLVQISTDFVFDGKSARPYRPDDATSPLSVYGQSKAAGEALVPADGLIVRTSWVYSASGSNFVRTMLKSMREREQLQVVSDQIGAPTWAEGLAQTIWSLVDKNACGTFHHSDAGIASWYDFAVAIQEEALAIGLLNKAAPIYPIASKDYPTPACRPAFSVLDSSATRDLLGDGHQHWRSALREMLQQEKALG